MDQTPPNSAIRESICLRKRVFLSAEQWTVRAGRVGVSRVQPVQDDLPRVVAIGASAGGLRAFEQLLEHLPVHTGLAFVLIVHLHPTDETLLRGRLSKCTSMAVNEAEDGMSVERDHVYVIPRNSAMTIKKGVLRLSQRITPHHPIDDFMRSLAEDEASDAVGVILSGTGPDGTLGVQEIKAKGGTTFAENKNSATFYEMSHDAITAGSVDFELTPVQIAKELARLGDHSLNREVQAGRKSLTRFFRDPETFADLKKSVFPKILQGHARGRRLRVWVPECVTGEDVYSVAITFLEFTETRAEHIPIEIFGTDSDLKMVERARRGIYPQSIIRDVSPEGLIRFFVKKGNDYQIGTTIRSLCIFGRQDLPAEPPLPKTDLIIFRRRLNDLMPASQERVIRNLHYSLNPTGLLLLGSQETDGLFRSLFALEDKKQGIYSRKSVPQISGPIDLELHPNRTDAYAAKLDQAGEEQLKGANEELRISVEKLACLNEELKITQAELQTKNKELVESNERMLQINADLENLLSSIQMPIVMIDQNYLIRRFTPGAKLFLKLLDSDVGRPITDFKLMDEWGLLKMLNEAMETFQFAEREVRDLNGCWYSVRVQPYMTLKNRIDGAVVAMVNVDQLKRNEQRLRLLVEQMVAGIAENDMSGRFTRVNQRYCEMTGYSRKELLETTIRDITHPADWPDNAELYRRLFAGGESFFIEKRYRRKDGGEVWVGTHVSPIRDVDGKIEGSVAVVIDVTDRKHAEDALRAAYERAEAATRAKDEFLSVVSHELRTPLVSILGYTQLLNVATPDAALVRRVVEIVETNSQTQLQLIEDLLDTARILSGKLRLDVRPLDVSGVISAALDVVRPAAQAKGIELQSVLDLSGTQITGDAERLQQTVWNLLSNAIKFTPKGGHVEIGLRRADPHVEIVVRDTGKGIDREFLPHVFERFRQSDMSSTRRSGGLGLGLALVKYLVELHGGTVEAASEGLDRGATFTVRLPLRAVYAVPEQEPLQAVQPAERLAGVNALVVDDEEQVRSLLTLTLETYGAKAQVACSVKDALELLTRQAPNHRFDVLICDIAMPDEDGYAMLRKTRAIPPEEGGNIPAIALTAYGAFEYRMRALNAGFYAYAVKPVKPDELVVIIQEAVKKKTESMSREAGNKDGEQKIGSSA